MGQTGTYVYNRETKQLEKVSDEIPKLRSNVFWDHRWDHSGYDSEALGVRLKSKEHKRKVMEKQGVIEKV